MERNPEEQTNHDKVVEDSAETYRESEESPKVYTNPNGEKNRDISGEYPDIIVIYNESLKVIEEIETENSVNETELEQWKTYSKLGTSFQLVVPLETISMVENLIKDLHNIKIQGYYFENGQIRWT